ncbi:MAG: DUF4145 domain-containing protein [Elainellaceae cyanobacterium]
MEMLPEDIHPRTKLTCNCGGIMHCERHFENKYEISSWDLDDFVNIVSEIVQVFLCTKCERLTVEYYKRSFPNLTTHLGYLRQTKDDFNMKDAWEFYYSRTLLAPRKRYHISVPDSLQMLLNEASASLSRSPRASIILCRTILEEICYCFKIPDNKGNRNFIGLKERLKTLVEQENLSEEKELAQIINSVKYVGDKSAHREHSIFLENCNYDDAKIVLELVEYIIERIYIDKFKKKEAGQKLEKIKNYFTDNNT